MWPYTQRVWVVQSTSQFLNAYPGITMVEALITDCNGIARGKWLPVQKLDAIEKQGLKLPKSALGLDVWGRDIPALAHAMAISTDTATWSRAHSDPS